jgi:hypothetical protein
MPAMEDTADTNSRPGLILERGDSVTAFRERFRTLARQWQEETAHISSNTRIVAHPAYQEIIRMGVAAVPLILRDLQLVPRQWFTALKLITGADPVPADVRGKTLLMAKAWLEWAHKQGICIPNS